MTEQTDNEIAKHKFWRSKCGGLYQIEHVEHGVVYYRIVHTSDNNLLNKGADLWLAHNAPVTDEQTLDLADECWAETGVVIV
jgi:hypothetical protein